MISKMSMRWKFVICALLFLIAVVLYRFMYSVNSLVFEDNQEGKVTIRRLDLLETFLDYYNDCEVVDQVQIIWSDTENEAPLHWNNGNRYHPGKMVFEIHQNNSLTNRFKPTIPISTEAVLSIDDDLIVPCNYIQDSLSIWTSNRRALLGYSPRIHAFNIESGDSRYLRWQHTWWNGFYSIMLTKVAFLHRDYLFDYINKVPKEVNDFIDKHRNCEDIAMAHIVAEQTNAAPVWVKATVFEVSTEGISSNGGHFIERSKCLDVLKEKMKSWPWVMGYQRLLKMSLFDNIYLYDD